MKRSMNSKIQINPVLKIGKGPTDNIYLHLVEKIQVKYGISRWIDKFPELVFRHMWMKFNENPTDNNGIIKNYTNYLEIYKSVFNLTAKTIKQLQTQSKQQLPLSLNLPDNIQWNKNIYLRLKQENNREVNRLESKNPSVNETFGISAGMEKEWPNIGRTIILNSLNNAKLSQHTLVNTYKTIVNRVEPNLEVSMDSPLRNTLAGSIKVQLDIPPHMELQRKIEFEKRADNEPEKVNGKIGQTVGVGIHYHKNPDNDMATSESILTKANTTEGPNMDKQVLQQQRNNKEGYSRQVLLKKNIPVEALPQISSQINPLKLILKVGDRNIVSSEKGVIQRNHEFFSETIKKEAYSPKFGGLIKSVVSQTLGINLQGLDTPLQSKNTSRFIKDFYIENIIPGSRAQLMPEVYTKMAVKVQEKDAIRVLTYRAGDKISETMKTYKDSGLTYLKAPKKETRDSSAQQLNEVPPIEKEAHSRTFTEAKENRNFKDIEADEINLLADRVFKVIEKRIEIGKDRRGLR
jgi:hypothetical protein